MKSKKLLSIILSITLTCTMFCSCQSSRGSDEDKLFADTEESISEEFEEVLDIVNLQANEYRLSELPGKIMVSDKYNVYSTDNEFTDEMCEQQNVDPEKMREYINMSETFAGIDMIIIPKDSPMANAEFEITIKVKTEEEYDIENLADVSDTDFASTEKELILGFEATLGTEITSEIYENANTKWIVYDWYILDHQTRYSTILNGYMVHVIGKSGSGPLSDDQKSEIVKIIDSLEF